MKVEVIVFTDADCALEPDWLWHATEPFRDSAERCRLGVAARHLTEKRYDSSCCLASLEGLYAELLPAGARR